MNVKCDGGCLLQLKHVVFLDYYNKGLCVDWLIYFYADSTSIQQCIQKYNQLFYT